MVAERKREDNRLTGTLRPPYLKALHIERKPKMARSPFRVKSARTKAGKPSCSYFAALPVVRNCKIIKSIITKIFYYF